MIDKIVDDILVNIDNFTVEDFEKLISFLIRIRDLKRMAKEIGITIDFSVSVNRLKEVYGIKQKEEAQV